MTSETITPVIPKVSIVIPTYNKPDYTVQAVESVLWQTYANVECIVVDDGSTNETYDKLFPYIHRINYIYQFNKGVSAARNKGIERSTGEYIGFLDCDDVYTPDKVADCIRNMEAFQLDFVHTGVWLMQNLCSPMKIHRPAKGILLLKNFICNSTPIMRKEVFDKVGLFDERLFICADWDMWLRISEHYNLYYINDPLTYYRI